MPQPLAPILPSAPEVSIVTSSRRIPGINSDGWAYGISHREDFCRTVGSWQRCVEEVEEEGFPQMTPEALGDDDFPVFMPWAIVASFTCTSLAYYAEARKSAVESCGPAPSPAPRASSPLRPTSARRRPSPPRSYSPS